MEKFNKKKIEIFKTIREEKDEKKKVEILREESQ